MLISRYDVVFQQHPCLIKTGGNNQYLKAFAYLVNFLSPFFFFPQAIKKFKLVSYSNIF